MMNQDELKYLCLQNSGICYEQEMNWKQPKYAFLQNWVIIMTGNPQEMSQDIIFQGLMMNQDELKYLCLQNSGICYGQEMNWKQPKYAFLQNWVIIMTGNPQEMSQDIIFQGLMMN
jgi:hypothetical protein